MRSYKEKQEKQVREEDRREEGGRGRLAPLPPQMLSLRK